MGRLPEQLAVSSRALNAFHEAIGESFSDVVRDASVKRFEIAFESIWKLLKVYLFEHEGVQSYAPRECLRDAFQAGLLNEEEAALFMRLVGDRNECVHIYKVEQAQDIYEKLPGYYEVMQRLHDAIDERIAS